MLCSGSLTVARDSAVLEISDYARGGLPDRCSDIILIVLTITRIGTLQVCAKPCSDSKENGRTTLQYYGKN